MAYGLEQPDYVRLVINAELSARFRPQIADWTARVSQGLVLVDTRYDGPESRGGPSMPQWQEARRRAAPHPVWNQADLVCR